MLIPLLLLNACSRDKEGKAVDENKVQSLVKPYNVDNILENRQGITDEFNDLNEAEIAFWLEEQYKSDLAAFEALKADPYIEKEVLNETGLPVDVAPSPDGTPDGVLDLVEKEGVHTERVKLTAQELAVRKAEIDKLYETKKAHNQLSFEYFNKSVYNLDEDEWEVVLEKYTESLDLPDFEAWP